MWASRPGRYARIVDLAKDGDSIEQNYWPLFITDRFPSYETFWREHVEPLTRRDEGAQYVGFRTAEALAAIGTTDEDVAVAQLHYSVLRHVGRAYDLLHDIEPDQSHPLEVISGVGGLKLLSRFHRSLPAALSPNRARRGA